MGKPQQYKGKVSDKQILNDKFQYLKIELVEPHQLEFQAGQYVSVDVGGGVRRSYSIASAPSMKHAVELCVDITPGGKGSEYIKNLQPGSEVSFLAPLGVFVMAPGEKKLLLVATGTGIAPLRSMILDLLRDKQDQRPLWLFWGLRLVKDMFWVEDWRQIDEYYPNFHYCLLLSQPPERWPVESGYVTEEMKELALDKDWGVYVCGNPQMMEEVKKFAAGQGVPEKQIHYEKFF